MPPPGKKSASTSNLQAGTRSAGAPLSIPGGTTSPWTKTQAQNGASIMSMFQVAGLSKAGAAGFVGNWFQESGLNPAEPGGYLGQWGGSRLTALASFAAAMGKPVTSIDAQVAFTVHELKNSYPSLLKMLYWTNDPAAAALAISSQYERPNAALANNANRVLRARQAFGEAGWGTQGGPLNAGTGGGGGGGFGSVMDILNSPVDAIGGWLAQIALNLTKDVAVGVYDAIVVPWWHWNQRAVDAYQKAMFSDKTYPMILWNSIFWGGGYWLLFTDPAQKGLKPAPVRNSRIARHVRFAQSLPARRSLIKPGEVAERTPTKPSPIVTFTTVEQVDTMRTHRPERVTVTSDARRNATRAETPIERAGTREGTPPRGKDTAHGKPNAEHRTGDSSLQGRPSHPGNGQDKGGGTGVRS